MSGVIPLLTLYAFVAWAEKSLPVYLSRTYDRVFLLNITESALNFCYKQYTARKKSFPVFKHHSVQTRDIGRLKCKADPRTGLEGAKEDWRYSSTPSSTSELDLGGQWDTTPW